MNRKEFNLLVEGWRNFLNENSESLPLEELQNLIDSHDFFNDKNIKVSDSNIHESGEYYLLGTDERFEHMKERHTSGQNSKPGSKFFSKINLLEIIKDIIKDSPNDTKDPTKLKWIEVEHKNNIGTEEIKKASAKEAMAMKQMTFSEVFSNKKIIPMLQDKGKIITNSEGEKSAKQGTDLSKLPKWKKGDGEAYMIERISVSSGEGEETNKISFISRIVGKLLNGKIFIAPITTFPGSDVKDEKGESITDRNKLSKHGYYFVTK